MPSLDTPTDVPARIAEQIRELISRGALSPGVHLGQAELAERFDASRVPVREALKLLAAEGHLLHDQNRGFFVATLSQHEARQLYRLRHLIEAELLRTVEWPDTEQLSALSQRIDEFEVLEKSGHLQEWSARHRDFHRAVFELSPDKILVREVLRLWTLTDRYRSLLIAAPLKADGHGTSDERRLVEALRERDRERLLAVFEDERTHVEQVLLGILRARGL